jgi:CelD/BcsL family acetyltransferase involved in cellulose biosynthesis
MIAKSTYQRGLRVGVTDSESERKRLLLCARKGWLRGIILYIGDRPVAYWIAQLYNRVFLGEYVGYDPEYRDFSPGTFLMLHVIDRLAQQLDGDDVQEIDWGPGDAEYKRPLSTREYQDARIFIFGATPKGLFFKGLRILNVTVDQILRGSLADSNLLRKAKRIWRDRVRKSHTGHNHNPGVSSVYQLSD